MYRAAVLLLVAHALGASLEEFRVVYEWYKLDFTWPDDGAKLEAYTKGRFKPESNIVQNIRIWRERAFLTLPRSKPGVPATLVTVPSIPHGPSASPRLEPFPSWSYQEVSNCASLQNVQAIEVDPDGYLWAADSGSVHGLSDPDSKCPPKLVIFNIEKRELVSEFEFSRDLFREGSILSDIVVDTRGNKTAYISVSSEYESAILVYHNQTKSIYKVIGIPKTLHTKISVNGTDVSLKRHKLSLALSIWENLLYFSPSWDATLYSVNLHALKKNDISHDIKHLGKMPGLSYGMILDSKQILYFGVIEKDSIAKWNTSLDFTSGQKIITEDKALLQFPASFGFDKLDNLWVVSNRFQTYLDDNVNLEVPNFRLIKAFTGSKSYLFAPQPKNTASSNVFSVYLCMLLLLCFLR